MLNLEEKDVDDEDVDDKVDEEDAAAVDNYGN
jgi:hypothetical protein